MENNFHHDSYFYERHEMSCRISLFGSAYVGKTKLVQRLMHNKYTEMYVPTIEEYYEATEEYTGMTMTLKVVDTSGTEQFPAMRRLNMEQSNLIVLVYDVTNHLSFNEIIRLYQVSRETTNSVIVIVGAKADFLPGNPSAEHEKCIKIAREFILSKNDERLQHCICSARTGKDVGKILENGLTCVFAKLTSRLGATSTFWERFLNPESDESLHDEHLPTTRHHGLWYMMKHLNRYAHEKRKEEIRKKISLPYYQKERRVASSGQKEW